MLHEGDLLIFILKFQGWLEKVDKNEMTQAWEKIKFSESNSRGKGIW